MISYFYNEAIFILNKIISFVNIDLNEIDISNWKIKKKSEGNVQWQVTDKKTRNCFKKKFKLTFVYACICVNFACNYVQ